MATRTVRLDEEAYECLAGRKLDDESFSDVVKRLAGEPSLLSVAGILSDEQADELEAAIEERRQRREQELSAIAERME